MPWEARLWKFKVPSHAHCVEYPSYKTLLRGELSSKMEDPSVRLSLNSSPRPSYNPIGLHTIPSAVDGLGGTATKELSSGHMQLRVLVST